jgi:hypothetical protein
MFTYRLHSPDGDDLGEATTRTEVCVGRAEDQQVLPLRRSVVERPSDDLTSLRVGGLPGCESPLDDCVSEPVAVRVRHARVYANLDDPPCPRVCR